MFGLMPSWWSAVRALFAYVLCLGLLAGAAFAGVAWVFVWVAL